VIVERERARGTEKVSYSYSLLLKTFMQNARSFASTGPARVPRLAHFHLSRIPETSKSEKPRSGSARDGFEKAALFQLVVKRRIDKILGFERLRLGFFLSDLRQDCFHRLGG
jgi:hypothetical protein